MDVESRFYFCHFISDAYYILYKAIRYLSLGFSKTGSNINGLHTGLLWCILYFLSLPIWPSRIGELNTPNPMTLGLVNVLCCGQWKIKGGDIIKYFPGRSCHFAIIHQRIIPWVAISSVSSRRMKSIWRKPERSTDWTQVKLVQVELQLSANSLEK